MHNRTIDELLLFHPSEPTMSNIDQHTLPHARREVNILSRCVDEMLDKLPDDDMTDLLIGDLYDLQHAVTHAEQVLIKCGYTITDYALPEVDYSIPESDRLGTVTAPSLTLNSIADMLRV